MARIPRLRVLHPCGMDWNAMSGDEKTRFCPDCGKNVHNVSALTRQEATRLVGEDGSVPCLRGVAGLDGSLMSVGQLAASNRRRFTQTILAAVPFAVLAAAQTTGGVLKGVVTDHGGAPLPGSRVIVSRRGDEFSAETDSQGVFRVVGVPEGSWDLYSRHEGFAAFRKAAVVIHEGAETEVSFHMDVGGVGGGAEVELKPVKRKVPGKLLSK